MLNFSSPEKRERELIIHSNREDELGKTTTFYITVGLLRPDEGRILLGEEEITDEPMYRRARMGVSYLPQAMAHSLSHIRNPGLLARLR